MFGKRKPAAEDPWGPKWRRILYGEIPLDELGLANPDEDGSGDLGEGFAQARVAVESGRPDEAVAIWTDIVGRSDLESRQILQAAYFLRSRGAVVPGDRATRERVLGAVMEMPVPRGMDYLSAYADGRARYLNFSGSAIVWEDPRTAEVRTAIATWLMIGQYAVERIEPWKEIELPPLAAGGCRMVVLTPSGNVFRQGPPDQMVATDWGSHFSRAARQVMALLIDRDRSLR